MLVPERHARQLEECKYLQAVAVIVGDAEQGGVGVKREHPDPVKFEVQTSYKRTAKIVYPDVGGNEAWPKADMGNIGKNVRFWGKSGHFRG